MFAVPRPINVSVPAGVMQRYARPRPLALPRRGYDHAWVGVLALAAVLSFAPAPTTAATPELSSLPVSGTNGTAATLA